MTATILTAIITAFIALPIGLLIGIVFNINVMHDKLLSFKKWYQEYYEERIRAELDYKVKEFFQM